MVGRIGVKCGSTRIYYEGRLIQGTVINIQPNKVMAIKTKEKDGYVAMVLASIEHARLTHKPLLGQYKKAGVAPMRVIREFSISEQGLSELEVGQSLGLEIFKLGQQVSVTGVTIGKGFAGCVKRHNFSMQRATHGNSLAHRAPGSIGQCQDPGRVFKNKKMPGRMGSQQVLMSGLQILSVDEALETVIVKGSVPGKPGGVVLVNLVEVRGEA